MNGTRKYRVVAILLVCVVLFGCSPVTGPSADDILKGMARVSENTIIRDALPTYIIMMETMLGKNPQDAKVLVAAARLYSMYGGYFVDEPARAKFLTTRALEYALSAADRQIPGMGKARSGRYEDFERLVNGVGPGDIATLFFTGSIWLDWARVRKDDLDAVADLPRIQLLMQRVVAFDADYQDGLATLYLAILAAMEYGDVRQVRRYFTLAALQADGKHLMADYFFAVWQVENGEAEAGCSRLSDILNNRRRGTQEFSLYNDFVRTRVSMEFAELLQQGKCHVSAEREEGRL